MQRPTLSGKSGSSQNSMDEEIQKAVTDVIRHSNDKVVEIRPASRSRRGGRLTALLLLGGLLAVGYWLRTSGRPPTETIQEAASGTADRTQRVTERAAETIQEGGETVAEQVEEGSEMAADRIEETGESAAKTTEEVGETAADELEESGPSGSS